MFCSLACGILFWFCVNVYVCVCFFLHCIFNMFHLEVHRAYYQMLGVRFCLLFYGISPADGLAIYWKNIFDFFFLLPSFFFCPPFRLFLYEISVEFLCNKCCFSTLCHIARVPTYIRFPFTLTSVCL